MPVEETADDMAHAYELYLEHRILSDDESLRQFLTECVRWLRKYAAKQLRSHYRTEPSHSPSEVVMDCAKIFLSERFKGKHFDSPQAIKVYLLRMIYTCVKDHAERGSRKRFDVIDPQGQLLDSIVDTTDLAYLRVEEMADRQRFLMLKAGTECERILRIAFVEYDIKEVQAITGVSEYMIKKYWRLYHLWLEGQS